MKYIIMECQFSYAVVLSEDGRFLTVANKNYHVGQTVTDITEMKTDLHQGMAESADFDSEPTAENKKSRRWLYCLAALAVCTVIVFSAMLNTVRSPYASVYVTINPEVRIDVNRNDKVISVEGVNEDGENLIEGYDYKNKSVETVMDELVDLAIEMEFLSAGGQITIGFDAEDDEWVDSRSASISDNLNEHLTDKIPVKVNVEKSVNYNSYYHKKTTVKYKSPSTTVMPATTAGTTVFADESTTDTEITGEYSEYGSNTFGDETTSEGESVGCVDAQESTSDTNGEVTTDVSASQVTADDGNTAQSSIEATHSSEEQASTSASKNQTTAAEPTTAKEDKSVSKAG